MAGVRWMAQRRVLRRASHQSLKVPVFREQSFDTLSQNTPAASYARGDWDAEYRRGDEEATWVAADVAPAAPSTTVGEVSRPAPPPLEDESWIGDRPLGDYRAPPSNALTFKPASRPWYGSQRLVLALVGAAVAALVVCVVLLVMRNASGDDVTTTVTPTATTSAVPQLPPNVVDEQPVPPLGDIPPPPPPPEADNGPPPANTRNYPRYRVPSSNDSDAPTGRPRTPAEISVAPTIKPPAGNNHSAPGDAPRHRGFFG